MRSLVSPTMHYIREYDGNEELYVLSNDPEERVNYASAANGINSASAVSAQASLQRFRNALSSMFERRMR